MQKAWYRSSKNAWFATILEAGRQKQIRLVTAPNDKDGKKLAEPGAGSWVKTTRASLTSSKD
jgi:hypothetical protein